MANIQRSPKGFLSLLGIVGQNPPPLTSENVQPTLEMLELYAADRLTPVSASEAAVSAIGSFADLPVPPTEAWLVVSVGFLITSINGALTQQRFSTLLVQQGTTNAPLNHYETSVAAPAVGDEIRYGSQVSPRLIMRPGMSLRTFVGVDPGVVTFTVTTTAVIVRLSV